MMAGANPGAVQRILRHSDPRITTEVYGHLVPDYLRSEIDRLRFGTAPANDLSTELQPSGAIATGYSQLTHKILDPRPRPRRRESTFAKRVPSLRLRGGRDLNPRPPA
jgi:hypothetical protein